jgi:hypothetical protein
MTKINNHDFEQWKLENQANLTIWAEQFKAAVSAGENALKSVILINGGAAVALLAFVGSIWDKSANDIDINKLLISMVIFVAGTLFGGLAMSWHYLEHNASKEPERKKWGMLCDWFVGIAYSCFVVASVFALIAFWVRFTGNTACK